MYEIVITEKALKQLYEIPDIYSSKIINRIDNLANEPFPSDCKKLKLIEAYRIRVNDYRIIYTVENKKLRIEIIRIKHRKEAYKNLS